jgi:hypothetical protein
MRERLPITSGSLLIIATKHKKLRKLFAPHEAEAKGYAGVSVFSIGGQRLVLWSVGRPWLDVA